MNWREVKITISLEAAEAAINLLEEYGARGVIIEDIKEGQKQRQLITAYYADDNKFNCLFEELKAKITNLNSFKLNTGKVNYQVNLCEDRNWNESWFKYFKATPVGGNFIICPYWEDCTDEKKNIIKLDPGQAFGTGGHITTKMAISLIEKYIEVNQGNINNMLDIGTGTAILSIAAAILGVKNITGIDIDRAAIRAARKNIAINNVSRYIIVKESNLFSAVTDSYSLLVANLLPNIILKLLPELPAYVKDKGIIILAGINDRYEKEILTKLNQQNFKVLEKISEEDWTALAAQKG